MELLAWLASVLGFLLTAAYLARDWLRSRKGLRISTNEAAGQTTTQYGFAQSSLRVVVANNSATSVEIHDVRLMFARRFGAPLVEAPPPRTHPKLPTAIQPGAAETWHFPAETLAITLRSLSAAAPKKKGSTRLRARVVTATGSVYRGRRFAFSLDPNDH